MTITYPIAFPTSLAPASMTLTPNDVVSGASSPFTGQEQVQRHPGQWWILSMEYPALTTTQLDQWAATLMRLKGRYGTFLFGDPSKATPSGVATGTPLVDGSSQAGDYLATKGWTPNVTGIMKAGDYIQIGTGALTTLYRLTADANSDGAGKASLEVWPQVRKGATAPTDNAAVIVSNPVGRFRLDKSTGWKLTPPVWGSVTINAHEAL